MTKQERGAIAEAIAIREALLYNPTLDNFARYRRAITNVARVFDISTTAAALIIKEAL
jgi:hypothetical protein